MLKFLLSRGDATGRDIADQVKLPFMLRRRAAAADEERSACVPSRRGPDERLRLSAHRPGPRAGQEARRALHVLRLGAGRARATTSTASTAQSLTKQHPTDEDLHRAFEDLLINKQMLRPARPGDQLGPRLVPVRRAGQRQDEHRRADHQGLRPVRSGFRGRSASTARSCGCSIPACTRKCRCRPTRACSTTRKIDNRWVRIRRPTIVVGGELTMDHLEVTLNTATGISEAPAADEEQLRHAGDRRLRPAADDAPTSCSTAGSCRWKSATTS